MRINQDYNLGLIGIRLKNGHSVFNARVILATARLHTHRHTHTHIYIYIYIYIIKLRRGFADVGQGRSSRSQRSGLFYVHDNLCMETKFKFTG